MFVVLDLLFVVLSEDMCLPRYQGANLLLFFVMGNSRDGLMWIVTVCEMGHEALADMTLVLSRLRMAGGNVMVIKKTMTSMYISAA